MADDATLDAVNLDPLQKCLLKTCRNKFVDVEHDKLTCCVMEQVYSQSQDFCWGASGETARGFSDWKNKLEDNSQNDKGQRQQNLLAGSKKAKFASCTTYVDFYKQVEAKSDRFCPGL